MKKEHARIVWFEEAFCALFRFLNNSIDTEHLLSNVIISVVDMYNEDFEFGKISGANYQDFVNV